MAEPSTLDPAATQPAAGPAGRAAAPADDAKEIPPSLWWAWLTRVLLRIICRTMYRTQVVGAENVPAEGPVMFVINHSSYMDGPLVYAHLKRYTRFVVYQGHYRSKFLGWIGPRVGSIAVASDGSPKAIVRSLRTAGDALAKGEALAIFPEGTISRVGFTLPFRRGFQQMLKRAGRDVPVVPVYVDGMWGSIFSFQGGKLFRKWPKRWRDPVTIRFGKPLPPDASVPDIRESVLQLGCDCYEQRKGKRTTLGREFYRLTRRHAAAKGVADSSVEQMTWGQTLLRALVLSRILARKLGPEKNIGLLAPPSAGGMLANAALALLGKVSVNLNYTVGKDVVDSCVRQAGVRQILASRRLLEKVRLEPQAELIYLEDLKAEATLADKVWAFLGRWLPAWLAGPFVCRKAAWFPDDLATIIFSSGSTGEPKGVMLSHHNVLSNAEAVVQHVDCTEKDCVLGVLPFFHSFGYTVTIWVPVLSGAGAVYHFNPLDSGEIGRLLEKYRCTVFLSTATFLRAYMRKCTPEQFQTVRILMCGAEKLPMPLADEFEAKIKVRPLEGYGCTELSPVVAANRADWREGDYVQVGHKPGTIGHTIPGVVARIVDPETHKPLPANAEGMLLIRSPALMAGYLGNPDLTAAAVKEGWYVTGDLAKLDEDGFLAITDRISRFSKIGGEMVPHGKVEEKIQEVAGAVERFAVVVGLPDPRKGEQLAVVHTALPISLDELWARLRDSLPPLWLPSRGNFLEVAELPVLGTGKLDLKTAKATAAARLAG